MTAMTSGTVSSSAQPSHSRAFETFVDDDPEDLVGLLAYGLYKQNLREAAMRGSPVPPSVHRHPTTTELNAYRGDAERRLQRFADAAIAQATPEIVQDGVGNAVEHAVIELTDVINTKTSLKAAIFANVIAWVITLAVTIIIVTAFYLPNWQADLIDRIKTAIPQMGQAAPPQRQ
jgi:hypothetical protein